MARRFDLGRALLAAGAALLLISLLLKWYEAPGDGDQSVTAWEVFEVVDLLLAALALGAVYVALRADDLPDWLTWALPAAALLVVVSQLIEPPVIVQEGDVATGAWLALAGSLLMAAGAALAVAAISVTVQVRERELRRRMAAVDRRERAAGAPAAEAATRAPGDGAADPAPAARSERDPDRTQPFSLADDPSGGSLLRDPDAPPPEGPEAR